MFARAGIVSPRLPVWARNSGQCVLEEKRMERCIEWRGVGNVTCFEGDFGVDESQEP